MMEPLVGYCEMLLRVVEAGSGPGVGDDRDCGGAARLGSAVSQYGCEGTTFIRAVIRELSVVCCELLRLGAAQVSGTTATAAVVLGWELLVANVGDSCAYLDTGAEVLLVCTPARARRRCCVGCDPRACLASAAARAGAGPESAAVLLEKSRAGGS